MGRACARHRWVRRVIFLLFTGTFATQALAEVSITDRGVMVRRQQARAEMKAEKSHHRTVTGPAGRINVGVLGTGGVTLIDASGLKYFINENITFATTSSASGAMIEASYTHAVAASTSAGGTTNSTLVDAFDGYNSLCVSLDGTMARCTTGNANFVIYNRNGGVTTECNGRQVVFNPQTIASLGVVMSRKVFVPSNDSFARWLNIFTNTGSSPVTFGVLTTNNLGSDSNTRIVSSSNGNNVAEITDTWVSTFQNFTGRTTSDPRLGHVLQGVGAPTPVAGIYFADGNDRPWWGYTLTLNPGETKIIMNFVTGQPTRAAANAKAAELATLPPNAVQCLAVNEMAEVVNFQAEPAEAIPALGLGGIAALILVLAGVGLFLLVRLRAGS